MRRLLRILLHTATALSLLLCLATLALWRRSYATTDQLYRKAFIDDRLADPPGREITWLRQDLLQSARGRIHLARFLVARDRLQPDGQTYRDVTEREMRDKPFHVATPATQPLRRYMRLTTPPPAHAWWPFAHDAQPAPGPPSAPVGQGMRVVSAPHWTAALLFAAPPAAWAWRRLRRRGRDRAGLCPACGYDLRATPDRCPECGARSSARDPGDVLRDMLSHHSGVPLRRITGETRLAEDLGMSGDDAVEFMQNFFRTFDVDARAFVFARYFLGECSSFNEVFEPPRRSITVNHLLTCIRQHAWTEPAAQAAQAAQQPGTAASQ